MQVAYVYPNPRDDLEEAVAAGEVPDSTLLGENHLASFGIDAFIHRPKLRRTERRAGLRHRITWNLREVTLPWELGDADVVCTSLVNILPLTSRVRRRPRVLLLNFGIPTLWNRASAVRRRALRASLDSSEWIVCLAEEHRRQLVEDIGLDPAKVFAARLGVDGEFFGAQPVPDDGYVLAIGKDLARDYGTFLDAVRGLDAKVVLVTSPHLLEGLDVPPNVELRGRVEWPDMAALYAGARVFALPVHAEGYRYGTDASGLTALLEAMATARPIVATDRRVFGDYVEPGASALLVPADDPAALRAELERVLADQGLAAALGTGARAAVDERLSTKRFAERLAAILQGKGQGVKLEEIPVALFAFKRPELLARTLDCAREAGFRRFFAFLDGPRGPDDVEGIAACRTVLDAVDWASMDVLQRTENIGNAASVVRGTVHVLERFDRAVLLEDDVHVAPGFGPFVAAALDHYADDPRVATVTGLRMPFSRRVLRGYPFDALMLPRYFPWSTAVWRRSWETFDFDRDRILARLRASDVRPEVAGPDFSHMIRSALVRGTLQDQFDVYTGLSMLLNDQVSVVPTWNMALHEGYEHATHVTVAPRWTRRSRWELDLQPDLGALRFPPAEPDPRILKAFRVFRENPRGWTPRRFVPRPARQALRRLRGTYDVYR